MIFLEFSGWFQCRLATDPDPHDERRGVSGYVQAYAGEPDLDRVLHWQPPPFTRPESEPVGVKVRAVAIDSGHDLRHPFLDANVQLLDEPKFEGRNGVIADDGKEPVYPFHLRVTTSTGALLQRAVVPSDPEFPYRELFASGVERGPPVAAEIAAATGILDLRKVWAKRLQTLQQQTAGKKGAAKVGLEERIAMLSRWASDPAGPVRFFGARMRYDYALRSSPIVQGWSQDMGPPPSGRAEWRAKFWLGGWDADALCGFSKGVLEIPTDLDDSREPSGARTDDRAELMTERR